MSPGCNPVCVGIGRTSLGILLLSGLYSSLRYYSLVQEHKTWQEARKYCMERYVNLASVDNMEDMERMIAAAGSDYEGKAWIGLSDKSENWEWSRHERQKVNFTMWEDGEPNDVRNESQLCVAFHKGFWRDYPCKTLFPFVCYSKGSSTETGIQPTQRYVFVNETRSWHGGLAYCKEHHTDLASVTSKDENALIQAVVPDGQTAAIGLHRDTWRVWSDGSRSTFRHWAEGHPESGGGNHAVTLLDATHRGKWTGFNHTQKNHFMCYDDKRKFFRIKLMVTTSTADLNDPEVTKAILNMIETKMKEAGITKDLKISWTRKPHKNMEVSTLPEKCGQTFEILP